MSVGAGNRNVDQGFSESGSLAFFGSTVGAMKSVVGAEALVLGVDVLPLLARVVLTTCSSQVDQVGVKAERDSSRQLQLCVLFQFCRVVIVVPGGSLRAPLHLFYLLSTLLHFVIEGFWHIQDVSGGSVGNRKPRQVWDQQLMVWSWL